MYLLQLLLMVNMLGDNFTLSYEQQIIHPHRAFTNIKIGFLLHSKADTVTDRSGFNGSSYFRIDRATSTVTTYIDTESSVFHIELDLYSQGNVLFSDGHSLRTTDGNTTQTLAGSATSSGYREAVGEAAKFRYITGFTQTSSSNATVVDSDNHCLRIIDRLTLQTETFAGVCKTSGYTDGLHGRFNNPNSVIADNQNEDNLLVTERRNKAVRHVDLTTKNVSTFFRDTKLYYLSGITQDPQSGDLYLTSLSALFHLTYQDKILTLLAGHQTEQGYLDWTFSDSRFNHPQGLLLIDNNKKILVADAGNSRLRVLDRVSNTTKSICSGAKGYRDGDVDSCSLSFPYSLLVSGDSVYIGQVGRIRKLSEVRVTTTSASYTPYKITPCEATYYRKSSRVCEYCDCTSLSQSDQCDNTGQCPCETSDGENEELAGRQCNWYIEEIYPLYGPVAGGTKVSNNWRIFISSGNLASFISGPYPENATTQELKVSLIAQDRTVGPEDVKFKFEYRPNPILEGIQSRKTFLNGGLSLNVTGRHMDSVAFPQMIVHIRQYGTIVSTATSVCNVVNNTAMSCPTPDVKEATDTVLNNQSLVQEDSSGIGEPLNGRNGLGYTLGFRYDGYDNDTDLKNHTNPKLREISVLKVFDDPKIYPFADTDVNGDILEFDPKTDKSIRIEGKGLDWDPDQWVVEIGRERCRVTSVFTNRIICEPPLKMPEIDAAVDYREHKGKQIPHVVVRIGNISPTVIGFVYYKSSLWEDSVAFRVCIIVLPIIAIVAFVVILLCHLRHKRNKDKMENRSNQPLDDTSTMNLMPVGDPSVSGTVETFLGRKLDENLVATLRRCRIPKASLTVKNKIGRGNFGTVYKATQITASGNIRTVAAKTLNESKEMTADNLETFLTEGTLMVDFNHVNVMSLVGVVFENDGDWPLVVLPYMENGDLHTLIKRQDIEIRMGDLLHFSHQIANGMDYLSKERFVHRNLAARNCMVDHDYIVKVADFGLSRNIYENNYYATDNSEKPLPVRWMAPECLIEGRYSAKSDVWSYGVIMWELLTRGGLPYSGVHNCHIKDYVVTGNRLNQPEFCPSIIYGIMSRCWSNLPDDRPEFSEISLSIKELFYEQASPAEEDGHDYTRCVTKSIEHDYTVPKPETEAGMIDDTRISRNDDYIDIPVETPF